MDNWSISNELFIFTVFPPLHFLDALECPLSFGIHSLSQASLCHCSPDSLCAFFSPFFISMLNLVYPVSCHFSLCWLVWCFWLETTPHFLLRDGFSCCSLSDLFVFCSYACSMQCVSFSVLFTYLPFMNPNASPSHCIRNFALVQFVRPPGCHLS